MDGVKRKKYLFTNKKQSPKGWLSASLGVISLTSVCIALYLTYLNNGTATIRWGAAVFLSLIFAIVGFVSGILSRKEPDRYYFFAYVGILFNGIVLGLCAWILYLGILPQ